MRFTKWLLLAVATCLPCTACAPVGEPYPEDATEVESPAAAVELMPAPTAKLPDGLRQRVDAAIEVVEQREILISNSFWTVVHGILGIGPKLTLLDPEAGRSVNAIEYICQGGPIRGMRFIPTEYGLDVQNGPMFVGQGHVDQFVADWTSTYDRTDLIALCEKFQVPCGPVASIAEIFEDPHYKARGNIAFSQDTRAGEIAVPAPMPRLLDTPATIEWLGPALGAHNDEIYRGMLGLSAAEIEALKAKKVM